MPDPVPVTSAYGWITASGAAGSFLLFLGLVVRQINPWRKQTLEAEQASRAQAIAVDQKLREDMLGRIEKLEADLKEQRLYYEDKLDKLTAAYDQKVDRLEAEYEAAARIARHELGNAKMRFRALVMLLRRLPNPPDGLSGILDDIEAMEAEQTKAEALEKGAQSGAKIARAGAEA
ncbi:hypothetical protein [Sphingomonas xinjiangensis]|uniref:Uncharacterized protein n=1 Tax=Sphingomonas xinjiangensis TaxID=643568 RepID=A0A840YBF1_9SPHN|nr:hypothetical protein [Sphingomonas xinjiangensis]MBB5709359.1 hypothetical protein [Sphingomonas xinjiangensis]